MHHKAAHQLAVHGIGHDPGDDQHRPVGHLGRSGQSAPFEALGLVASLNRPGANVTGIANLASELAPKQLQLLRELLPGAARFAVIPDLQAAERTNRAASAQR